MEITSYIIEKALILVPVLIIIGQVIKNLEIKDKYIPLILMLFGILGALAIMGMNAEAVIQGILVAGAAVFGNQLYKQLKKEGE
ncbi:phage holin family protein [Clostridium polynesiense]|uniref:phage holin family protein n=1 Tax=Clostridium polynesiense TaxID=1325933 RepID=UPI00058AFA9B|nr:phage holin family protein [Clostridium polynesiense]